MAITKKSRMTPSERSDHFEHGNYRYVKTYDENHSLMLGTIDEKLTSLINAHPAEIDIDCVGMLPACRGYVFRLKIAGNPALWLVPGKFVRAGSSVRKDWRERAETELMEWVHWHQTVPNYEAKFPPQLSMKLSLEGQSASA